MAPSETSVRARLRSLGYRLQKTPARSHLRAVYGVGYMVMNDRNIVVLGVTKHPFDATLDDVAELTRQLQGAG